MSSQWLHRINTQHTWSRITETVDINIKQMMYLSHIHWIHSDIHKYQKSVIQKKKKKKTWCKTWKLSLHEILLYQNHYKRTILEWNLNVAPAWIIVLEEWLSSSISNLYCTSQGIIHTMDVNRPNILIADCTQLYLQLNITAQGITIYLTRWTWFYMWHRSVVTNYLSLKHQDVYILLMPVSSSHHTRFSHYVLHHYESKLLKFLFFM